MRKALVSTLLLTLLASASAASFGGVFADPQSGVTVSIQESQDGGLSGVLDAPGAQYQLQGQVYQQDAAYGVINNAQGQLGFQAYLSPDGTQMQFALFSFDANGQPVPQGNPIVLARTGGAPAGPLGGQPQFPGQAPGGQFPTQPQAPAGQFPTQPQAPGGQFPTQPQAPGGQFPTQPGQAQVPGSPPFGQPQQPGFGTQGGTDWIGTFTGDAGSLVLSVSGSQGNYVGYVQSQGQRYPFQAHIDEGDVLHGEFQAGGATYEFWAYRQAGGVMLDIGQATYVMQQTSAQPTP